MRRLNREAWITGALAMLDAQPEQVLSIERLARRLQVTRGSFYHHFANRRALVDALLLRWEQTYTTAVIEQASRANSARGRLERYLALTASMQPGRERALRRWADREQAVATTLRRVDAARLEFVRRLARSLLPSAADGVIERAARLGFLAFVGLQQTGLDSAQALRDLADDWVCLVSVDAGDRTRGTTPG